jgi:hypothetical protein
MHKVQLKIPDNIYQNVMFLLKNLNLKGFSIQEDKTFEIKNKKLNAIRIKTNGFKFDRERANAR